jgi:hypothetical protein
VQTLSRSTLCALAISSPITFVASLAYASDALTIRELAPETALLVLGMDDVKGTIDRLGATAYGRIWNDPSLAEETKKIRENLEKDLVDAAARAGVERDAVTWPSSIGLALMVEVDEELGLPAVQSVFFCDWSAEAEKATKLLEAIVADIEKEAKDTGRTAKTEEIRGRRTTVVSLEAPKAADGGGMDADMDEEGGDFDDFGGMGFGGPDLAPKELCLVTENGRLFAATSMVAMDMLLGRVDGDRAKAVGDSDLFKDSMALAGGTQDLYAMISTKAAQPLLGVSPQFMLVQPLIERFFGDIQAWTFGMHAKDGVLEASQGIYVPGGKKGLLALVDASGEVKAPPTIVPSDAMSYGRMNVRFDRLVPMLDEAIAGLPADQGEMIKPQLDMYRPAMNAAFGAMGPDVHLWSVAAPEGEPFTNGGMVTAISMKNDKDSASAVIDFINLLPLGLQSRDFNGMTILSDEFSPIAVGIGGGYMVLGGTNMVEQALRSVDAKGEAGLAGDAGFTAAMGQLPKEAVAYSWTDLVRQLSGVKGSMDQMLDRLEDALDQDAAQPGDGIVPGTEVGMDDIQGLWTLLKPETVKAHMGPGLLDFTSEKNGFMTRYRIMPAQK